ncbi:MAG: divalent-cation tolerance protein CutA [Cyanobacteria bacterium P01_A01_bin.114]
MAQLGIVLVTAGSETEAKLIASALVESNLAACVNIFPVQSVYRWQGEICQDLECQLTDLALFSTLEAKVRALHSYEVPEIIAIALTDGSPPYLSWLQAQVGKIISG